MSPAYGDKRIESLVDDLDADEVIEEIKRLMARRQRASYYASTCVVGWPFGDTTEQKAVS